MRWHRSAIQLVSAVNSKVNKSLNCRPQLFSSWVVHQNDFTNKVGYTYWNKPLQPFPKNFLRFFDQFRWVFWERKCSYFLQIFSKIKFLYKLKLPCKLNCGLNTEMYFFNLIQFYFPHVMQPSAYVRNFQICGDIYLFQ